jgi:hypothetical protein
MPGTKIVETLEGIPPGASFENYPWNNDKDFFGNGQAFFLQTPKLSYILMQFVSPEFLILHNK